MSKRNQKAESLAKADAMRDMTEDDFSIVADAQEAMNAQTPMLAIHTIADAHNATRQALHAHIFNGRNSVSLVDILRIIAVDCDKHQVADMAKIARRTLRKKFAQYANSDDHRHPNATPDNAELFDRYMTCALVATRSKK